LTSPSLRGLSLSPALSVAAALASLSLLVPVQAGILSGSASLSGTNDLPPDAVFEAVLIDIALADAPARELGRVRLRPAGQPPFRFTIPYRDADITPQGRYTVRATVRSGQRLLFTTDTISPVLTGGPSQPLTLQLVPVAVQRSHPTTVPLGRLPASWRGDLPAAGGTTRWQVDLASDGSFQLRRTALNRPAPNSVDDIGRWRLEPESNRLVLRGGREAPLFLQPVDGGAALLQLGRNGEPIPFLQPDHLQRLASAQPIDPRLSLQGMFRYLADAASIRLCATGAQLPVAMEGDFRALERAYLKALPAGAAGQAMLVNLHGLITSRPSMEIGRPPQRTLVVERFVAVQPDQGCPPPATNAAQTSAPHAIATPLPLRGTLWTLQALQDGDGASLSQVPGRPMELLLANDQMRLSGSGGCNRLIGGYQLDGEQLRFSQLGSTQMACAAELMAFERRTLAALAQVRRWSIETHNLLLLDGRGRTLLSYRPARLHLLVPQQPYESEAQICERRRSGWTGAERLASGTAGRSAQGHEPGRCP